jgi:hypothetical protein
MRESRHRTLATDRRRFLELGAGAFIVAGAVAATVRVRGYDVPPGRVLVGMSGWQFVVTQHAARRIAAADRVDDPSIPRPDAVDVAGFVDAWTARMDERIRRDFGRFLAYLEHVAPLGVAFASRFTRLTPSDQDRVLGSVEASSIATIRAGFDGLKSLVFMGYYRDIRTWRIVGYDGPWVGRPPGGWW